MTIWKSVYYGDPYQNKIFISLTRSFSYHIPQTTKNECEICKRLQFDCPTVCPSSIGNLAGGQNICERDFYIQFEVNIVKRSTGKHRQMISKNSNLKVLCKENLCSLSNAYKLIVALNLIDLFIEFHLLYQWFKGIVCDTYRIVNILRLKIENLLKTKTKQKQQTSEHYFMLWRNP